MAGGGWGGHRDGAGRKPAGYEHPEGRADFERERAEHERVKREQREFKLAVERGEYIKIDQVRQASATLLAVVSQSLRSLPDNLERRHALAPDVVEGVTADVDAALAEMAAVLKAMGAHE